MKARTVRTLLRTIHILCTVFLGTLAYAPPMEFTWLQPLVAWVVFPIMAFTGIGMWQQARLNRLFRRGDAAAITH